LVLINVTSPQDVVREMVRVDRPGGWVALQEVDWITWACEPAHAAWDELLAALTASWQAAGLDPFIDRRLPALLRDAGMGDVGVDAHQYIWRPGDLYHTLLVKFVGICCRTPSLVMAAPSGVAIGGGERRNELRGDRGRRRSIGVVGRSGKGCNEGGRAGTCPGCVARL
jgi:hypothetical protein